MQNHYVKFLKQVITHWPEYDLEASGSNTGKYLARLADYISDDFDSDDLISGIKGFGGLKELSQPDDHLVIIKFLDGGSEYKAEIQKGPDGKLLLKSLKYECPGCFGEGKLEDIYGNVNECGICGGRGWGI